MTRAEIFAGLPGEDGTRDWESWYQLTPEGGEPFAQMQSRMRGVLDEVLACKQRHVLIVSHAGALRVLFGLIFSHASAEFDRALEPAGLTKISFGERGPHMEFFNDVSHYGGL
ncbi:MAG: hypothetical protein NVS9B12_02160 [Vulcanimicrobiaceae bacterium]